MDVMETPDRIRMHAKLDYSSCVIMFIHSRSCMRISSLAYCVGWEPGYNTLGLGEFQGHPIPAQYPFCNKAMPLMNRTCFCVHSALAQFDDPFLTRSMIESFCARQHHTKSHNLDSSNRKI